MKWIAVLVSGLVFLASCSNDSASSEQAATEEQTTPTENSDDLFGPMDLPEEKNVDFDWQGHRGARGYMPENTFQAFAEAINAGVNTLEMDLVISKDSQVVVSHEPWINSKICLDYKGNEIPESDELNLNIFEMNYDMVRSYDCGSKGNPDFPEQRKMKAHKPLLKQIFNLAKSMSKDMDHPFPYFNLELKSKPDWVGVYVPDPSTFVSLVLEEIKEADLEKMVNIQSFDPAILKEVKAQNESMPVALLVDNANGLGSNVERLGFTPEYYSPHFLLCTEDMVEKAHDMGMKVIPWTVNDTETMQQLKDMGVDGIITDFPNKKI
jgi:glycerophosphoryl diester phosphodiesterase